MAPYDVAIYGPACAGVYLETPASGGAERQLVLLARWLARQELRVCHIVENAEGLPRNCDGVDIVCERPQEARRLPGAMLGRVFEALGRADARVYVQRSAGLATGLVGGFARSRRRRFIYACASDFDLTGALAQTVVERVGFRVGLPLADAVVAQTADQLAGASARYHVVHIPSLCEPAASVEAKRRSFLWVGRAARYKHPEVFVGLAQSVPEARFTMVGCEPGTILNACSLTTLPRNLEVVSRLPQSELLPLYTSAIAVVNTSDFEGFPNTFMEGWARGALALSLRVDPDMVITTRRIGRVAGGSTAALAELARTLWCERDRLSADRQRAMQYIAECHAPERVSARWKQLIDGLL